MKTALHAIMVANAKCGVL